MLTCRELIGFLDDYREGRLSAPDRERFDWHLARCPSCVAYIESYERTIELARRAERTPAGESGGDAPAELIAAVLASRKQG